MFLFLSCFFIFSASHAQLSRFDITSEPSFKEYFTKHADSLNDIEGIWQVSAKQYYFKEDTLYDVIEAKKAARVAIIDKDGKFLSYIITGEPYNVEFTKTDVAGVYFYRNFFKETNEYSKTEAVISKKGEMQYEYEIPDQLLRLRLGELFEPGIRVRNEVKWKKVFPEEKKKK
jgi:hypothetical protein